MPKLFGGGQPEVQIPLYQHPSVDDGGLHSNRVEVAPSGKPYPRSARPIAGAGIKPALGGLKATIAPSSASTTSA